MNIFGSTSSYLPLNYGSQPLVGGSSGLSSFLHIAAPVGGAYLGWTRGSDLLRNSSIGQSVVGWLSNSPVGGILGTDPYRPVGGALGALAGYELGNLFF